MSLTAETGAAEIKPMSLRDEAERLMRQSRGAYGTMAGVTDGRGGGHARQSQYSAAVKSGVNSQKSLLNSVQVPIPISKVVNESGCGVRTGRLDEPVSSGGMGEMRESIPLRRSRGRRSGMRVARLRVRGAGRRSGGEMKAKGRRLLGCGSLGVLEKRLGERFRGAT